MLGRSGKSIISGISMSVNMPTFSCGATKNSQKYHKYRQLKRLRRNKVKNINSLEVMIYLFIKLDKSIYHHNCSNTIIASLNFLLLRAV